MRGITITSSQVTSEQIREWVNAFVKTFMDLAKMIAEAWRKVKDYVLEMYEDYERSRSFKQEYKLDFSRKSYSHQVMNRKPRHINKKIIN